MTFISEWIQRELNKEGWNIKLDEGRSINMGELFCGTGLNKLERPQGDGSNMIGWL